MAIAALPEYIGKQDLAATTPGMRFGMYLKLWGEDERTGAISWDSSDTIYRERGRDRQERQLSRDNKRPVIDSACRLGPSDKEIMQAVAERQHALSSAADDDVLLVFDARSIAPFTTGFGNEHPLENGFAFLWPYGLPYLPGSGIKGVLRQAVRELTSGEWGDSQGWDGEKRYTVKADKQTLPLSMVDILFGLESQDAGKEHFRGVLSFRDVIPLIHGDKLMVEIMTAHQTHYYQNGEAPHDSGSPNPIPFLTVPPGSEFSFHVACDLPRLKRVASDLAGGDRWKALLQAAFEHAFDWLGFGAKTAVGYGAMCAGSEKGSSACPWVDETIAKFVKENNARPEEILRGKLLANAWQALDDDQLKREALADIRCRWQQKDWWDAPPGKASKAARKIYETAQDEAGEKPS